MKWLISLGVVIGVWIFLNSEFYSNLGGRKRSRDDIAKALRQMILLQKDGGYLRIRCRGSGERVECFRREDERERVFLQIRVPREDWAIEASKDIENALDRCEVKFRMLTEADDSRALFEAEVPIKDIWSVSSGHKGERVAQEVLDALGIQREAAVDLSVHGERSTRWLNRELEELREDR